MLQLLLRGILIADVAAISVILMLRLLRRWQRLPDEFHDFAELQWTAWCLVCCYGWRMRERFKNFWTETTFAVLLVGGFWVFLDAGTAALRSETGQVVLAEWLGIELPPELEAILVFLALLIFLHHYQEWKK